LRSFGYDMIAIMRSLAPEYLERLRFTGQDAATLRAIGEAKGREALYARQSPEALEALRVVATIESTESSNRIEGITAPKKRIEGLVLKSVQPRNRSEQEIAGYRDALALIHEAHRDMPFTVGVVQQLHATIFRYLPGGGGAFKRADNLITQRDPRTGKSTVRFQALSAAATPGAMQNLVDDFRDAVERHEPLVTVPLAVLDFLCIHPFTDGNGRVARLITLLLLYHAGYDVGRYISLERIFEETKETYYESLEVSSRGWQDDAHDGMPWTRYSWGVLLRAYQQLENRVGTIREGRGAKAEIVRSVVLGRALPFSISELAKECPGVSRPTIRRVLGALRAEGVIEVRGHGAGARWYPRR
jgi:Fic family protein